MTSRLYWPQHIQDQIVAEKASNAIAHNMTNNECYYQLNINEFANGPYTNSITNQPQITESISNDNYFSIQTDTKRTKQNESLPQYQCRQNKMLQILHEYETMPLFLVSGFIRDINLEIIPQDLVNLCFKFYQHQKMAEIIDSRDHEELYSMAWEATENEEYLFAEQIIDYLLKHKTRSKQSNKATNNTKKKFDGRCCSVSEDASTTNLMAVIKYFLCDWEESEKYFKMASCIDPQCDIIMNNYAVLLLEAGRFEDAETQIVGAIEVNPECMKNHQQYAYILYAMNKYEGAAKECQLMMVNNPNIESYSGYAWLLEQMGRFEESKNIYHELIALEPDNAIWHFWYALLLQRCCKYKQSMLSFKKCVQIDPFYEGLNGNYAYSLYLNGEYQKAHKYITIAIKCNHEHLCVHYYYALIMIQLNNIQCAVNELYQCLEFINNDNCHSCKNEKGCLVIDEHDVYRLLTELGY